MKAKHNKLSAFLLFMSIGLMMLPVLQKCFKFHTEKPLYGYVKSAPDIKPTIKNWFDGSYGEQKGEYINENFGFRSWFVRLRNEVYYDAFEELFSSDVTRGKSGFFFERDYLETYSGMDYLGDSLIKIRFKELRSIQDTLAAKGILFMVVFAPGQASFYPEYIPEPYHSSPNTNYIKSIEEAQKNGINYIDFNKLFSSLKQHSQYPLYSAAGSHYTTFGAYLAFDSLNGYIEQKLHRKLVRYNFRQVFWSDSLMHDDDDIIQSLNLLKEPLHVTLAYPLAKWSDTGDCFKPRFLGIGDSYLKRFYQLNLLSAAYTMPRCWYYYQGIFDYKPENHLIDPGDMDLKSYVERQNVVILMASEIGLKNLGWNFIEDLYNAYKMGDKTYDEAIQDRKRNFEMNKIRFSIVNTPGWIGSIEEKAKKDNISPDSALQSNVAYMYDQEELLYHQSLNNKIDRISSEIRSDKNWLATVQKQANEKHISLDSAVQVNAIYEYNELHKNDPGRARQLEIENVTKQIYDNPTWLQKIKEQSADLDIGLDSCVQINAAYVIDNRNKSNGK